MGGLQEAHKIISCVIVVKLQIRVNASESCFDHIFSIVKNMLPEDKKLTSNFYRMKKMVVKLGLGYEKINICVNNSILYYKKCKEDVVFYVWSPSI